MNSPDISSLAVSAFSMNIQSSHLSLTAQPLLSLPAQPSQSFPTDQNYPLEIIVENVEQLKIDLPHIPVSKITKQKTIFFDLRQVVDVPMFADFASLYFTSWTKTQVVTQLCRMYIDLDKFSAQILDPFEKIKLLQDVILREYDKNSTLVFPSASSSPLGFRSVSSSPLGFRSVSSSPLHFTNKVLTDVANIMEYDATREFIEKYFLNWDVGDFVTVMIRMYKSLDRYDSLTQLEKLGILHHLIDDKQSRRIIASAVSSWKSSDTSTFQPPPQPQPPSSSQDKSMNEVKSSVLRICDSATTSSLRVSKSINS